MHSILRRDSGLLTRFSGLFLSAGKSIFLAGPGVAVISYLVVGTILWYRIMRASEIKDETYWCTGPSWRAWER
jgi:hypothetical protein